MLKIYFTALLVFTCLQSYAHESARGKIHATVGPYIYQTQGGEHLDNTSSPILGGFGLIGEGGVDKNGGVELSMIYLHKVYIRTSGDNTITEKMKRMHMSVGYRHWFNTYFSAALGYFTSYSMGDPHTSYSDFPGGSVYTSARRTTENGFDFSLQYEVYRQSHYAIVMDARYSMSITDRSGEDSDVLGVMIGFKREIKDR